MDTIMIPVKISAEEIAREMDTKSLVGLVLNIDLAVADCDFTEQVILKLVKSLQSDLDKDQKYSLFLSIKKILNIPE